MCAAAGCPKGVLFAASYISRQEYNLIPSTFSQIFIMGTTPSKPLASTPVRRPVASTASSVTQNSEETAFSEKRSYLDSVRPYEGPSSGPKSANGSLTVDNISAWESTASGPVHTLARTMMPHSPITSLQRRQVLINDIHVFNNDIKFKTSPIANQRDTGRCWLFASTNVLRYSVMRNAGLSEFQLSQVGFIFYGLSEYY